MNVPLHAYIPTSFYVVGPAVYFGLSLAYSAGLFFGHQESVDREREGGGGLLTSFPNMDLEPCMLWD